MPQQVVAPSTQPCVWMCAGLVSYRLCNRDFDCEHCPLDAALRGELPAPAQTLGLLCRHAGEDDVPDDRLYSTGHTWAQSLAAGAGWRVGIDAFAAALIGNITSITCDGFEHVRDGEPVCDIDLGLGVLHIGAPLGGRILRHNEALATRPLALLADPYHEGWLAELAADDPEPGSLLTPEGARHQLALDLRKFRRAIAFRLLASATGTELKSFSSASVGDLRDIIAGAYYVECIRDFIH